MKRILQAIAASTAAFAAALAIAQPSTQNVRRVAYVWLFDAGPSAPYEAPFRKEMERLGWVDGKTVRIETHDAKGDPARLDRIMEELVRSKVDVIVAMCTPEAKAALKATSSIPIVVTAAGDLVAAGIVKSYSRPGANLTGFSSYEMSLPPKRVELLKQAFPGIKRPTILWNPARPDNAPEVAVMIEAAKRLGMQAQSVQVRTREELATALEMMAVDGTDSVLNAGDPLVSLEAAAIARRAAQLKAPSLFTEKIFVENGAIMSYGTDLREVNRRAAAYVDRILRGAKPGDLPIEIPSRYELDVNRKAARQMGFRIPDSILLRADRVID